MKFRKKRLSNKEKSEQQTSKGTCKIRISVFEMSIQSVINFVSLVKITYLVNVMTFSLQGNVE